MCIATDIQFSDPDRPDVWTDHDGLDVYLAELMESRAIEQRREHPEDYDLLLDEVRKVKLRGWQFRKLRGFIRDRASQESPYGREVREAFETGERVWLSEANNADSLYAVFLPYLAVGWLRERREDIEALFKNNHNALRYVSKLF